MVSDMPRLEKGWGFPYLAKKAHYFDSESMTSLCGKWMYTGARVDEFHQHDENCVACMRMREKLAVAPKTMAA